MILRADPADSAHDTSPDLHLDLEPHRGPDHSWRPCHRGCPNPLPDDAETECSDEDVTRWGKEFQETETEYHSEVEAHLMTVCEEDRVRRLGKWDKGLKELKHEDDEGNPYNYLADPRILGPDEILIVGDYGPKLRVDGLRPEAAKSTKLKKIRSIILRAHAIGMIRPPSLKAIR